MQRLLLSCLAVVAAVKAATDNCQSVFPDQAVTVSKAGQCYGFFLHDDQIATYADARSRCRTYGGTLAMPKSSDTNGFLASTLKAKVTGKRNVWIGLDDEGRENVLVWADGSPLNSGSDYSDLTDAGSKVPGDLHGLALTRYGKWLFYSYDIYYESALGYVCQTKMPLTTPTPTGCPTTLECPVNCANVVYKPDVVTGCYKCVCDD